MPTGYTHNIKDGITFEQFVWQCARAFGALIELRDSPNDAPIPAKLEASTYYAEAMVKDRARLAELQAMTAKEAAAAALRFNADALESHQTRAKATAALRASYEAMADKVNAWVVPTPEHLRLRAFMLEQLQSSIDFDCHDSEPPRALNTAEWLAAQLEMAQRSVAYSERAHAEELERVAGRNAWLTALRESVPIPA